MKFMDDCPPITTNGPEISDGRPGHGEAGSKREDIRQKKPAATQKFLCWPPSEKCVMVLLFSGPLDSHQ